MHNRRLKRSVTTIALVCVAVGTSCGATGADEGHHPTTSTTARTAVTVAVTAGTTTTTTAPPPDLEIRHASLTTTNHQTFGYLTGPDSVTITAPDDLDDPNVRELFWTTDVGPVRDGQACTTWDTPFAGHDGAPLQPGLAMRIASSGPGNERIRAVTITENVWGHGTWLFNVHVWDTALPTPMMPLATWNLADVVAPGAEFSGSEPPRFITPPWHLCGRTEGNVIDFKVWADGTAEPSWSDPGRVFSTVLPPGWDHAGYSGGYIGHMHVGQTATAILEPTA